MRRRVEEFEMVSAGTSLSLGAITRRTATALALLFFTIISFPTRVRAQAAPLAPKGESDVHPNYERLLSQIDKIPVFDNHAHPAFADDTDVDAMAAPEGASEAFRIR